MRFVIFISCTFLILWMACTSPIEQKRIKTQIGSRQLYFSNQAKTGLAWAPDSSKFAFQTPVGLVTLLNYSLSGEMLDTLITINVPFYDEDIAPIYLSPDGSRVLYQKTEKKFNVIELASEQSRSYRFPDLHFVSPMRWSEDGSKIYAATQTDDHFFLSIFDPQTDDLLSIELDSLTQCRAAQLYGDNTVLYTGVAQNEKRGIWLKKDDGSIMRISSVNADDMVYFPDSDIVLSYEHDAELSPHVIKRYSLADGDVTILNEDFESIWTFERIGKNKVQIGGSHADARFGIFTLSVDGDLQQLSNWWPFELVQWADDGQAVIVQKVLDDNFSAVYVYDLFEEQLVALSDAASAMLNQTPVFTPNSRFVVYSRNGQLVRVPVDGGEPFEITPSNTPAQFNPKVSPNGAWIACDDGRDIYIVPVEGGELRKISVGLTMSLSNPTWSPDGQQIACEALNSLEILNFDGEQLSEEKSFTGQFDRIEWARAATPPFGAPILYRKHPSSIAMINPETGDITDAFSFRHDLESFCWAANGRDIIYTTPWLVFHTPLLSSQSQ